MRWLFLFVFSLNLAYIGWEMRNASTDDSYADVPALKNVQTIVLLSELKRPQAASVEVDGAGSAAKKLVTDRKSVENSSANQSGLELTDAERLDSVQVAVDSQAPAEKNGKAALTSVTQSDVKKAEIEAEMSVRQNDLEKASPVNPAQSVSCFTLGPFRDLDKLRGLTREIKTYVSKTDFRGSEEKEQSLYWVYLRPEKNRARAIKTGRRLKAKKIKDFYVIRDGEKINGLSLGYFRNKSSAFGLAKKVKSLGFNVVVEPVFKTYTIYWLDYQLTGGVSIPDSIFDKYTRSTKKQKISRLPRDCAGDL